MHLQFFWTLKYLQFLKLLNRSQICKILFETIKEWRFLSKLATSAIKAWSTSTHVIRVQNIFPSLKLSQLLENIRNGKQFMVGMSWEFISSFIIIYYLLCSLSRPLFFNKLITTMIFWEYVNNWPNWLSKHCCQIVSKISYSWHHQI